MPIPSTPMRVRYQTFEIGDVDLHLCTLRDNQQFYDPDNIARDLGISSALWPIFGIIWPSSLVLAHHLEHIDTKNKKILEIGCGMAMSSLVLNKKGADVTATDYHPEVGNFLKHNAELNNDKAIKYERTDWADEENTLESYDLIIGSDLLYEDQHIELLANFIQRHANPVCEVVLTDPGRGRKNKIRNKLEPFGFEFSEVKPVNTDYLDAPFKGHILTFTRK